MQNFGIIIYFILFSVITFGKIFLFVAEAKPLYHKPFLEENLLCHADTSLIDSSSDRTIVCNKISINAKKSSPLTFSPPLTF